DPVPHAADLLRLGACRDQPAALRPGRSGVRTRRRLLRGIFRDAVHALLPGRICQRHADVRDADDPVLRRLAAAPQRRAVHLRAGDLLVPSQGVLLLPFRDGEGRGAALSLRSAHATRLEGVPADLASLGGGYGGLGARLPPSCVRRPWPRSTALQGSSSSGSSSRASCSPCAISSRRRPRSTIRSRRARSAPAFAASTRSGAIPPARSAASPASCARRSALPRRSPSRPSRATTAAAVRRATTSTW